MWPWFTRNRRAPKTWSWNLWAKNLQNFRIGPKTFRKIRKKSYLPESVVFKVFCGFLVGFVFTFILMYGFKETIQNAVGRVTDDSFWYSWEFSGTLSPISDFKKGCLKRLTLSIIGTGIPDFFQNILLNFKFPGLGFFHDFFTFLFHVFHGIGHKQVNSVRDSYRWVKTVINFGIEWPANLDLALWPLFVSSSIEPLKTPTDT